MNIGYRTVAETLVKPYQTKNILLITQFKAFFNAKYFLLIQSHNTETFDLRG